MNLRDAIDDFRKKKLDPANHYDARRLLKFEACRRLEGFVFEDIFLRGMRTIADTPDHVTAGWYHLPAVQDGEPHFWFRLATPAEPSTAVDAPLVALLERAGCRIVMARYDEKAGDFEGSTRTEGRWSPPRPIADLFREYGLTPSEMPLVEPWTGVDPAADEGRTIEQRRDVLEVLLRGLSDAQRYSLVLGRLFIYSVLHPWYRGWPSDVDAVAVVNGEIGFFETKRLNPGNPDRCFLLEEHRLPYLSFLEKAGRPCHYVFMVDPLWNKRIPALGVLERPALDQVRWVHVEVGCEAARRWEVNPESSGAGMHGGAARGARVKIPWDRVALVGSKLDFSHLKYSVRDHAGFLVNYPVTYDDLRFFHDAYTEAARAVERKEVGR